MTDLRNDDDLEQLLRSTLGSRADLITSGPAWPGGDDVPDPRRPARRRWVAPVAAAAAAAVVAAVVAVIGAHREPERVAVTPPDTSHPITVRPPAPATSTAARITTSAACMTALPTAWADAVARGTTYAGARTVAPLAMFPDGRVVVARDFGSTRDVALVGPGGKATSIYQVPSPDQFQALAAQVEGNTVLIQVARLPRNSNGVLPVIARLVVIDPGLGEIDVADVADVGAQNPSRYIDGAAMLDGKVYFDVRHSYPSPTGQIFARDLDHVADPAKLVYSGRVTAPTLFYNGVGWTPNSARVSVPRAVPAAVTSQTRFKPTSGYVPGNPPVVNDDSTYAWAGANDDIGWYDGHTRSSKMFRLGTMVDVVGVTGDYVLYSRPNSAPDDGLQAWVLDVRSGATAAMNGIAAQGIAGAGVLGMTFYDVLKGPVQVVRLDTTNLPGLTC